MCVAYIGCGGASGGCERSVRVRVQTEGGPHVCTLAVEAEQGPTWCAFVLTHPGSSMDQPELPLSPGSLSG